MKFSSKEKYQRWLAYGHVSGVFAKAHGNQPVIIRGKPHRVCHKR
jgi:hypothetical protein